jgi:hypothetical protein
MQTELGLINETSGEGSFAVAEVKIESDGIIFLRVLQVEATVTERASNFLAKTCS